MTTPGDESRTELAWREIVEHYGERHVLDEESAETPQRDGPADPPDGDPGTSLPDHLVDDDPVEERERAAAEADRFRPPPAPPLPLPRTWQRGVAWAGVLLGPAIAVVIGLFSVWVPAPLGWLLVAWFVGGFVYLVREMPRAPRDPWDDGSRV